ncbi:hypothetical protein F5I97DRAFT_1978005 [Phlebopus sp. FC_14]|nr:hypothetical protein F5I97DRAFT_1978005 [Phlebopus sp. FC_14]
MATLDLHIECVGDSDPWDIEQHMFDVLSDYLQPSSTMSPITAAEQFNFCFPLNRTDGENGEGKESEDSFLWELWSLVLRVAQQVPHRHPSQDRLAQWVKALVDFPIETRANIGGVEQRFPQDLPLFHQSILEFGHTFSTAELHVNQQKRKRWQNFSAFIARLTRDRTQPEPLLFTWTLRDALENEPDPRSKAYQIQGPTLDAQIPATVEWILVAGPVLYQACSSADPNERVEYDAAKGGRNFRGPKGLSMERWHFWKERFLQIQVHGQVAEGTRLLAKQAVEVMEKIEHETEFKT